MRFRIVCAGEEDPHEGQTCCFCALCYDYFNHIPLQWYKNNCTPNKMCAKMKPKKVCELQFEPLLDRTV